MTMPHLHATGISLHTQLTCSRVTRTGYSATRGT